MNDWSKMNDTERESYLEQLIACDLIVESKEIGTKLTEYANSQGYIATYFEYRRKPHVSLKREGAGTIAKPLRNC